LLKIAIVEWKKTSFQTPEQAAWCEFFRTGRAPAGAPAYIKAAARIVDVVNMDPKERQMLTLLEKFDLDQEAVVETAYNDGKTAMIHAAMSAGFSDEDIAKFSGLPAEEIAQMRAAL
jgi:hypothetical protein